MVLLTGFSNTGADATSSVSQLELQPSVGSDPGGTDVTATLGQSEPPHSELHIRRLAECPRVTQSSTSSGGVAFEPKRVLLCGLLRTRG